MLEITTTGDPSDYAEGTPNRSAFLNATVLASGFDPDAFDFSRLSLDVRAASVELTVVIAGDSVGEVDAIYNTLLAITSDPAQYAVAFGVAVLVPPILFEVLDLPPSSPPPHHGGGGGHSGGSGKGRAVGIALGVIFGLTLLGAAVAYVYFRKGGFFQKLSLKRVQGRLADFGAGMRWGSLAGGNEALHERPQQSVERQKSSRHGAEMQPMGGSSKKGGLLAATAGQSSGPSRIERLNAKQNSYI